MLNLSIRISGIECKVLFRVAAFFFFLLNLFEVSRLYAYMLIGSRINVVLGKFIHLQIFGYLFLTVRPLYNLALDDCIFNREMRLSPNCMSWLRHKTASGNEETVLKILRVSCTFSLSLLSGGVMVIVVRNGLGNSSSNPGREWLHFT